MTEEIFDKSLGEIIQEIDDDPEAQSIIAQHADRGRDFFKLLLAPVIGSALRTFLKRATVITVSGLAVILFYLITLALIDVWIALKRFAFDLPFDADGSVHLTGSEVAIRKERKEIDDEDLESVLPIIKFMLGSADFIIRILSLLPRSVLETAIITVADIIDQTKASISETTRKAIAAETRAKVASPLKSLEKAVTKLNNILLPVFGAGTLTLTLFLFRKNCKCGLKEILNLIQVNFNN